MIFSSLKINKRNLFPFHNKKENRLFECWFLNLYFLCYCRAKRDKNSGLQITATVEADLFLFLDIFFQFDSNSEEFRYSIRDVNFTFELYYLN